MAELAHTCTSGDEVTADNVLLHTLEVVGLARDGGLVEHLGRFLEGSGGHEALGLESCASDTLKNLGGGGGLCIAHLNEAEVTTLELRVLVAQFASGNNHTLLHGFAVASIGDNLLAPDAVVLFGEVKFVDNLLFEEAGIAGLVDLHLAHHLTDDDLEVLVVDLHTLEAVNVLHLVDDVFLHGGGTLDGKDVAGRNRTVGERRTSTYVVVLLHENLLGEGHEVLLDFAKFGGDDDFAVATLDGAHGDFSVDFGNDGGVARVACFEELGILMRTSPA